MKRRHSPAPVLMFALVALNALGGMGGIALGQDVTGTSGAKTSQDTILHQILNGGPLIILIWCAILATSMTMVTLMIQNIIMLRREKMAPGSLIDSLRNEIDAGNYQAAWETCAANDNYLANVLRGALERVGRGKEAVDDAVAEYALREAMILRTRNSYLSVIGVVSPMIGLLGTVIGMMKAFDVLSQSGMSDMRGLASSIGEVLTATASGLFVAIPAFISYYLFRNRAQEVIVYADDQVGRLLQDIPFEELSGLQIGEIFNVGQTGLLAEAMESRRVSLALTTNCPVCNGAVKPGETPCPHCGATLDWAA